MSTQTTHDLAGSFLGWLENRRGTSFVEIERWLAGQGINPEGTYSLEPVPNLVIWAGVSEEFCDFFNAVKPHVDLHPLGDLEALLVYSYDGKMLRLPLAKRPPRNGYKDPHWAPCVVNPRRTEGDGQENGDQPC